MIIDILVDEKNTSLYVKKAIRSLTNISSLKGKLNFIIKLFNNFEYLRCKKNGLGRKRISYIYFLELYNYFPDLCIELINRNLIISIGYWKDLYLIWNLILDLNISDRHRYNRYNRLIEKIKDSLVYYRNSDVITLNNLLYPKFLVNVTEKELDQEISGKLFNLSYLGKYTLREKSALAKKLHWFNDNHVKLDYFSYLQINDKRKYRKENSKLYYIIKNNKMFINECNFKDQIVKLVNDYKYDLLKKLE